MTPFAASVPYSTLDAGPLAIWTVSRSIGSMSLSREGTCPPTPTEDDDGPLSTRIPSTTSTGSFDSDTLFEPRIRIREPLPVVPRSEEHTSELQSLRDLVCRL